MLIKTGKNKTHPTDMMSISFLFCSYAVRISSTPYFSKIFCPFSTSITVPSVKSTEMQVWRHEKWPCCFIPFPKLTLQILSIQLNPSHILCHHPAIGAKGIVLGVKAQPGTGLPLTKHPPLVQICPILRRSHIRTLWNLDADKFSLVQLEVH